MSRDIKVQAAEMSKDAVAGRIWSKHAVPPAWNSVIAGAGVLGGILLDHWGAHTFPLALTALLALGLVIVWSAKENGFRPGPRSHAGPLSANS